MTGLGRKERYSETGPQNEKEQQLLLLSRTLSPPTVESRRPRGDLRPTPISSVPLPLRWPDRRRRGWGMRSEVVGVQVPIYYR